MDVRYAKTTDNLHIAYGTLGDGPPDMALLWSANTHIRRDQEEPQVARFHAELARFSRVVLIDERGDGMSDSIPSADRPSLGERMDDLRSVLDAMEIEQVTLFGFLDGGPLAMLFAATYPERVARLVLFCTFAAVAYAEDYPIGITNEILERVASEAARRTDLFFDIWAPSATEEFRTRWANLMADNASPARIANSFRRSFASDVRAVLISISAPTLVMHRRDCLLVPVAMGRYIADHIQGARFVELEGADTLPFVGNVDAVIAEIEEFVTGERTAPELDRRLMTLLFTDIVDSTKTASALGDYKWRQVLDDHDQMVHRQLERFGGTFVKSTGDGVLATFDGPARAVRCAGAILDAGRRLGLGIRAGLHAGECEARGADLAGIAVHITARIETLARDGEVLVSGVIPPLVTGSEITFTDRGCHQLKGVPGDWNLFAVASSA